MPAVVNFARALPRAAVLLLFLIGSLASCSGKSLQPSFQVFRIVPDNGRQLEILKLLHENAHAYNIDFWKAPSKAGVFTDLMTPWKMTDKITNLLTSNNISYSILIPDVSKLLREKEGETIRKNADLDPVLASFYRRFNDESSNNKAKYNFEEYGSYTQMTDWMRNIEAYYPSFTKVFEVGKTHEGRSIQGIKFTIQQKRAVWIDGGIHAREWAAIHSALYFINELVSNYGSDPMITSYIDNLNFYIVPCLNPDGYAFSFSATDNPMQRFWRKNRSSQHCTSSLPTDPNPIQKCCRGVDLNRNFDFHWAETGSNSNPCAYNYRGPSAFSEPETRALRDMLLSPELRGKTDAYITMHTYAQMWMYPWGHQPDNYPEDISDLKAVADEAADALKVTYGTKYKTGTGADLLYSASGASSDWAKKAANVKYAYVLELRPALALNGFILNKNELLPTAKETWAGVKVVINAVLRLNGRARTTA